MRIYNRDLRKSRRWLAGGRNSKVIRYLEPKVPLFLEDPTYYVILGRACLMAGLLKDADTWLNRGLQADPEHLEVRLTLAVNHLKKKDPAAAVRTWLEVLEDHPKDKHAKRGLKALKRISHQEAQDRFLAQFEPGHFLPSIRSRWQAWTLSILLLMLISLIILLFQESLIENFDTLSRSGREVPAGIDISTLSDNPLTNENVDVLLPLTDGEVSRLMHRALRHFQNYEDNKARVELNRIKYSNASDIALNQALGLLDALGEPRIDNLETSYQFDEVNGMPWLYEGCWVLWRGRVANVVYGDDAIRFEFLVGYDDGTILEGRVPVEVPFLTVMESLPLELLGRVELRDGKFILVAKTLHFLR